MVFFRTGRTFKHLVLVSVTMAMAATLLAGLLLPGNDQRTEAQTSGPPNFVVIMTDDLDERSLQQLGGIGQVMSTNGTTFENAFVSFALCCPSRSTFFRGQYAHNHSITSGLSTLGEPKFRQLGLDQSTVATWLNDAGYQTKYLGKYLNGYYGSYVPPGWDEWFALSGAQEINAVNDDGQLVSLTGNSNDAFAAEASDFIQRSSAEATPFFVMVGTRAPHRPPEIAARYQDRFATTPLPEPPNFDEADVSDKPQWVRSYPRISQTDRDAARKLYRQRLRSMLSVEDLLRQVVATLQETDELENTYIFFTSDNGFHLGNHRLVPGDKKTPYEEDTGVPLMVRGPGVPAGAVRQQLVINNDFAPTIADLAGATTPPFVDGRSFAPLLTSTPPSPWRRAFLQEGWRSGGTPVPNNKAVRTQNHILVEYDTGEHELYDLAADPHQLQSLPRDGNEALYTTLETRLYNLRDCSANDCRTAEWSTDATAPRATATVPGTNAAGVSPTVNLAATFSEDMRASSVNATTFELFEGGTTAKVGATVSYSAGTDKAILDPTSSLKMGTTYEARVSTGARDLAGNYLDQSSSTGGLQQKAWSFEVRN